MCFINVNFCHIDYFPVHTCLNFRVFTVFYANLYRCKLTSKVSYLFIDEKNFNSV